MAAPLYGSIGDRFGRRPTLLAALTVFTVASLGCALAPTLLALILARAVQGLGGGGLMTLSQALISENVPPRQRAQFQGYFAGVFAASSTLGPLLGALLTEQAELAGDVLHQSAAGRRRRGARAAHPAPCAADSARTLPPRCAGYAPVWHRNAGAAVCAFLRGQPLRLVGLAALLSSSRSRPAAWPRSCVWEMRTPDPVIPVRLLASPVIWRSNLVVVCFAAALFGSVLYLPLYLQLGRGSASGLRVCCCCRSRCRSRRPRR